MYCHIHRCQLHHCQCGSNNSKGQGGAFDETKFVELTQEFKEELKKYTVLLKDEIINHSAGIDYERLNEKISDLELRDLKIVGDLNDRINTTVELSDLKHQQQDAEIQATKDTLNNLKGVESISELLAIPNPYEDMKVYVKSYHAGLNKGGGYFTYDSSKASENDGGHIINGWERERANSYANADDYGLQVSGYGIYDNAVHTSNSQAIQKALDNNTHVVVPSGTYAIAPDIIKLNSGNVLEGSGNTKLQGWTAEVKGADGRDTYVMLEAITDAKVKNLAVKNGFRGVGIKVLGCKRIVLENTEVDGMTYGYWIGESLVGGDINNRVGCQDVTMLSPRVLNTRYWGLYLRSSTVTDPLKDTQNIKIYNSYYYNCSMAGFVASEGHVRDFVLDNPYFERCNVCMHFEGASNFTVINPRDTDTGKKPDHQGVNTEYPFTNWSMYHISCKNVRVIGGELQAAIQHSATAGGKTWDISYIGTRMSLNIFEGVGSVQDTDKDFFKDISFINCTVDKQIVYVQSNDAPKSYINNLRIIGCNSLMKGAGNGTAIAVSVVRGKGIIIKDSTFTDSALRITSEGHISITGNTWTLGTDNTKNIIKGGYPTDESTFFFVNNFFAKAGGVVIANAAFEFTNFRQVRVDSNYINGNWKVSYGYILKNNYIVRWGGGYESSLNSSVFLQENNVGFYELFRNVKITDFDSLKNRVTALEQASPPSA